MEKTMRWLIALTFVFTFSLYADESKNPEAIVKKCIEKHGGWDSFASIKNLLAKMNIVAESKDGQIESTFEEYFRGPNLIRMEVKPLIDPPTKLAWDGKKAVHWQNNKVETTDDEKVIERLNESLRLINLMILTNLFQEGTKLSYVAKIPKGEKGIHVISQKSKDDERIRLYISGDNYLLIGADFKLKGEDRLFKVIFTKHVWLKISKLYLPLVSKVYQGKDEKPFMTATLKDIRINRLANGNSFFRDLNEKAEWIPLKGNDNRPGRRRPRRGK